MRLDGITSDGIEVWLSGFKRWGLSNASGNTALMFLRIMLEEAKRRGLIATNPCDGVKPLPKELKKMEILTPEEVRALFPADWREVWADETQCVLNKLAACTGMRIGEMLGLRGEYVFNGYVTVAGQHGRYGYGGTKTHMERKIPVPGILESASGFPPLPSVRKGRQAYAADIFTLSLILYRLRGALFPNLLRQTAASPSRPPRSIVLTPLRSVLVYSATPQMRPIRPIEPRGRCATGAPDSGKTAMRFCPPLGTRRCFYSDRC
jgi:integrase